MLSKIGVSDYRFCVENDCYVCDKEGNFYSVCYRSTTNNGGLYEKYRINKLKGSIDRDGYRTYKISLDGRRKHLKAHRLMLNAWKGVSNLCVNHIDGNKLNNHLENIEWVTVKENNIHAIKNGLRSGVVTRRCGLYRIHTAEWMTIYVLNKHFNYSITKLAKSYKCSRPIISEIIKKIRGVMKEAGIE